MTSFSVQRTFIAKRNPPRVRDNHDVECDRCGLVFKRYEMRRQRGLLVDEGCFDDLTNERGGRT